MPKPHYKPVGTSIRLLARVPEVHLIVVDNNDRFGKNVQDHRGL